MKKRNEKWIGYWNSGSSNKAIHGRGSYPDEVYNSIAKDVTFYLDITPTDSVADIGGGTGDQSKYIIQECNPSYLEMFEANEYALNIFTEWIQNNNLLNIKSTYCILPDINFKKRFTKVFIGGVLMYMNSLNDIELIMKKIYDSLEDNGKLLMFHNYDKETWVPNEWDLFLISYDEFENISKKIGFKSIKRVKIGLHHGNDCIGNSELSVLLTK